MWVGLRAIKMQLKGLTYVALRVDKICSHAIPSQDLKQQNRFAALLWLNILFHLQPSLTKTYKVPDYLL